MTKAALSVALIAGLAACGNDDSGNQTNPVLIAAKAAGGTAARIRGDRTEAAAEAPRTPEQMAAEALRVNQAPLVMVGFRSLEPARRSWR